MKKPLALAELEKVLRAMPRDLWIVVISMLTWGVGEGMFMIFLSLTLEEWGASPIEIGGIYGVMAISMAVFQAPAGYLGDRLGSRPVMWASWVLGTSAAVIMAMANSLAIFIAGILTYGLTSFVVAPMNSYITSVRGKLSVQRALTIPMAAFFIGSVAGSLAGGVIGEALGLMSIYRISAFIFLVSTIIVLQAHHPPVEERGELHASQPNLIKNPRFISLLVLVFLTMFALNLPQPLTPNYLQNGKGLSLKVIGQIGAMGGLGNALLMIGLGHLNASAGFFTGQVLVGLFAILMWRGEATAFFFIGYFLLGGYRLSRSMVLAYSRTFVKASETGFAYGLVETGNAVSAILAPVAAGFLYSRSPHLMYITSIIVTGVVITINAIVLPKPEKSMQAPTQVKGSSGESDAA